MDLATPEALVQEALTRAASQNVSELKSAEAQIAEWETQPGFYSVLMRIITNLNVDPTVRWMAALTFKNGVDRYWRKTAPNAISEEEKAALRVALMGTFKEPVNQVATQLAVLISKASRMDYPREWPQLIPTLMEVAQSNDELAQHRAFLILHHVIKTLASKRLTGDRRQFQQLTVQLYPFILNFNNAAMETFLLQVQRNDPQCQGSLDKALLTLRILRKLTIDGFKEPQQSADVIVFLSSVFDRAKTMLHLRVRNRVLTDMVEKVIVHLTKVMLSLLEHHPYSFVPFIIPALSFSVSLLFTPEGDGLLFERFVVQCLNLIKGVLVCAEYKLPKGPTEEGSPNLQATQFKREFFQTEILGEVCRKLVTQYLLLTRDELEKWDADPEEFEIEDGAESWKYNLRPCTESLFCALFHEFREGLSPVLVELVYANHRLVDPQDLQAVLRKDAVYLATGLAAFDLYDEIDIDKWFDSLQQELSVKDANYRIIRRRAAWLLGEWSAVKLSEELRPALYRSLISLLQGEEDFAVRLAAAKSLKISIDNFGFDPDQFMEFLQPTFDLLFNLLKESKECETKMHVLNVLSFIVERVGVAIRPYSAALIQYLPLLWDESLNHNMLRCAIVCTLAHFVRALVAEDLTAFLYPVIEVCVDIHQEPHLYLLEDGLELWLAMLENSATLSPPMLHLAKRLSSILEEKLEHMQPCCLIIQAYILLAPPQFLMEYGEVLFNCCKDILPDVNAEGTALIFKLIETTIRIDPGFGINLTMPLLQEVFLRVYGGRDFPMVMSSMLSLLSRVFLHSAQVFSQILDGLAISKGESVESSWSVIFSTWLVKMPLVTQKERRKLLALALSSLLTIQSQPVVNQMPALIHNVVEALNDIVEIDDNDVKTDTLVLARQETEDTDDPEIVWETEHTRRMRHMADHDPVYNIVLHDYFQSQMNELKNQLGAEAFDRILQNVDSDTMNELRLYITI